MPVLHCNVVSNKGIHGSSTVRGTYLVTHLFG